MCSESDKATRNSQNYRRWLKIAEEIRTEHLRRIYFYFIFYYFLKFSPAIFIWLAYFQRTFRLFSIYSGKVFLNYLNFAYFRPISAIFKYFCVFGFFPNFSPHLHLSCNFFSNEFLFRRCDGLPLDFTSYFSNQQTAYNKWWQFSWFSYIGLSFILQLKTNSISNWSNQKPCYYVVRNSCFFVSFRL